MISAERRLGRYAGPAIDPFIHRRHHRTLERAVLDADAERQVRNGTWWGGDPRWFASGTPPRQHNRITPLIDGDAYFTRLYDALTRAERYVYITGWCLTPHIPLLRGTPEDLLRTRLVDVLSEIAQRLPVRILLWAGAPAVIQPTRGVVKRTQDVFARARGDLLCALDETAQMSHCHHQKSVVIDGQLAFVGGMDLTTFAGDRWDRGDHGLRAGVNWHDVEALIEGEAVADVERNFRERWSAVTGDASPPHEEPRIDPSWETPAQIVRTIPRKRYDFAPDGEFGIYHAYIEAVRAARRLIYIETQYLWSPHVMDALVEAMDRPRDGPFRIIIVLPARATSGKWDNDLHVEKLRKADRGRGIVEAYSPYASGATTGVQPFRYRPAYVHAKVAVIDDDWFTVGSANLNNRGLITDSELNVVSTDALLAKRLRCDLWAEHLAMSPDAVAAADPIELIDGAWRDQARANADIMSRGEAPLPSHVHRYDTKRTPDVWLLEESETLAFEH